MNTPAIVKPIPQKVCAQKPFFCEYVASAFDDFSPKVLTADYWQAQNAISGTAQGRGTTYFVETKAKQNWVLRHYYRGGLIGKLINDSYLYTGIKNTRAYKEFHLLAKLVEQGLPVPEPIAYRIHKKGLTYSGDILTKRIMNAQDLVGILSSNSISSQLWQKIGSVIKSFHKQGVYHHDLNAHNILIDQDEKVWIIDFDQGEIRSNLSNWPQGNMERLLRSFRKEKGRITDFVWEESDWQHLMQGYQS